MADNVEFRYCKHELTSRNLPHAPPADAERLFRTIHIIAQLHRHPPTKHKEHHVHFPGVLRTLRSTRREVHHPCTEEGH